MKKYIVLLIIIVILPLFSLSVSAAGEADGYISEFEDAVPEDFDGITEDRDELIEMLSPRSLFTEIISVIADGGGEVMSFFLRLVGCAVLMSAAGLCHEKFSCHASAAVGVICSLLIFDSLGSLFVTVEDTLTKISDFFAALTPITVGITALGGGVSGAGVQASGMYTALSLVGGLGGRIFMGISAFGLAMSLLSSLGNEGVSSITKGVKELFGRITGIFTALLTAAYSLQTIIASAADSAAMRAAKYAASGLIPIVGTTVAGAISTLTAGMSYAKGVVGGGAIAVIIYLALAPLALLLLYRLALSVAVIFSDFTGSSAASRIFSSYRFALDMTVTVYSLSALVYLFMIILFIRIGATAI